MDETNSTSDSSEEVNFDDFMQVNGEPYWWGSDFRVMLGIGESEFNDIIQHKAIKVFLGSGQDWMLDIRNSERNGKADWKLSRFACLVIAMNCDPSDPRVAQAQHQFAQMIANVIDETVARESIDRVKIRHELTESIKTLNSTATRAGVKDFQRFFNEGYRGLYNMYNYQLARRRGVEKNRLLDHMGRTELAANLFKSTMTEERLRKDKANSQLAAEQIHYEVGRQVREMVKTNTGVYPENLPVTVELPTVKKNLKSAKKSLRQRDTASRKGTKKKDSGDSNSAESSDG